MRFEELSERQERGALSRLEASAMLGMSERTFRRWRDRPRDEIASPISNLMAACGT